MIGYHLFDVAVLAATLIRQRVFMIACLPYVSLKALELILELLMEVDASLVLFLVAPNPQCAAGKALIRLYISKSRSV